MQVTGVPLTVDEPDPQPSLGRLIGLAVVVALLFGGLAARLYVLQVVRYADYERLASQNRVRIEPAPAPRGGIFDCRGTLLAGSRMATRVAILDLGDSSRELSLARRRPHGSSADEAAAARLELPVPTTAEQLRELADLLGLPPDELASVRAELADPTRPKFTPVVMVEDADPAALTRVEERLWRLPSVMIESVPLRSYPLGPTTGHVVGYVGVISPRELEQRRRAQDEELASLRGRIAVARREYTDEQMPELERLNQRLTVLQRLRSQADSIVGKTGLEAMYEAELCGEPGMRTWQVNARNRPVKLMSTSAGEAGHTLRLHLDAAMQALAANRFGGRRGSAVAIDCRDGAVLTLYGSPSYDPNLFIPRIRSSDWQAILGDPARPLQNRAIRNSYPPGSTFKLVTSAAGLKSGAIDRGTSVSCPGGLRVGSMFKRCWSTHGGGIDLIRGIAVSCDTFFYRAGLRMGPEPLRAMAAAFGVGSPTGIDLPSEQGGRLPTEAWHKAHHDREWYPGDTANIAIGQGDVACTTLQMAVITAAVANGGQVYRPRMVREIVDRRGRVVRPWQPSLRGRLPIESALLARIRFGMRQAVVAGTAGAAALPNVAVAGKTGSAEDPPRKLPHAWFVCFAPYERPEIAVAVMVENAGHGGSNSAPIAHDLMDLYFRKRGRTP